MSTYSMHKFLGPEDGDLQLHVPSATRPGHFRSISTPSIPNNLGTPYQQRSAQIDPTADGIGISPVAAPGVPPNTSQTLSGMVTPARGAAESTVPHASMTTILAGNSAKPFKIMTDLLVSRSPYFRELLGEPACKTFVANPGLAECLELPGATIAFPELDEFAVALFNRWLYGAQLTVPSERRTLQHYLGLYVLALHFRIERLENEVMDLVRAYYLTTDTACPPYWLEYIYANTRRPNKTREFLVLTTTRSVVARGGMSDVMRDILSRGGQLTVDCIDALIALRAGNGDDSEKATNCNRHRHVAMRSCRKPDTED